MAPRRKASASGTLPTTCCSTNWVVTVVRNAVCSAEERSSKATRGSRGPGSAPLNRSAVRSGPSTPIVGFPQFQVRLMSA